MVPTSILPAAHVKQSPLTSLHVKHSEQGSQDSEDLSVEYVLARHDMQFLLIPSPAS